jgi:hypothetical protein
LRTKIFADKNICGQKYLRTKILADKNIGGQKYWRIFPQISFARGIKMSTKT